MGLATESLHSCHLGLRARSSPRSWPDVGVHVGVPSGPNDTLLTKRRPKALGPNPTTSAQTAPQLASPLLGVIFEKHHKAHMTIGCWALPLLAPVLWVVLHQYL